jgi:uncharacterized protein YqhQ
MNEVEMSKINIGGQAVIEGVMMRLALSIAVRRPSGEIVVRKTWLFHFGRFPVVKLPIIRGAVAFSLHLSWA